jgi:hypothetical protein
MQSFEGVYGAQSSLDVRRISIGIGFFGRDEWGRGHRWARTGDGGVKTASSSVGHGR